MLILPKGLYKEAVASSSGCCVGIQYFKYMNLSFNGIATEALQLIEKSCTQLIETRFIKKTDKRRWMMSSEKRQEK